LDAETLEEFKTAHKGLQKKIEHKEVLMHAVNDQIKNV
jgi:hypothetical protein